MMNSVSNDGCGGSDGCGGGGGADQHSVKSYSREQSRDQYQKHQKHQWKKKKQRQQTRRIVQLGNKL